MAKTKRKKNEVLDWDTFERTGRFTNDISAISSNKNILDWDTIEGKKLDSSKIGGEIVTLNQVMKDIETQKAEQQNDIVKTNQTIETQQPEKSDEWYRNLVKKPELFNDGYQPWKLEATRTGISTVADLALDVTKGAAGAGESAGKFISASIAQVADWTGHDEFANRVRYNIAHGTGKDLSDRITNLQNNVVDKNSISDTGLDKVAESTGYMATLMAAETLGGSALGNVIMFSNGAGGTAQRVYSKENATDLQAWTEMLGAGYISYASEHLGGFFGAGLGFESKVIEMFNKPMAQFLVRAGINASEEALEEVVEAGGNYVWDRVVDLVGGKNGAKFSEKINLEELAEEAQIAFATSLLFGGASDTKAVIDYKNNYNVSTNEAIEQIAKQRLQQEKMDTHIARLDEANQKLMKETNPKKIAKLRLDKRIAEYKLSLVSDEFYVSRFDENGELASQSSTYGQVINKPNRNLNVIPAVVRNADTDSWNVIDAQSGLALDTNNYTTFDEAEKGFNKKIKDYGDIGIKIVNEHALKANMAIQNKISELQSQKVQDNIQNITQVDENENTGTLNNEIEYYTRNKLDNFKTYFNNEEGYTNDDIANVWQNLDEQELPVILNNNGKAEGYIVLDENENENIVVNKITPNGDVISSEEIPQTNGLYTATDIQNTIERVFNNAERTQIENTVGNSDNTIEENQYEVDSTIRDEVQDIKNRLKTTKLNVSSIKNSIPDYNDFRKSNYGKLRLGNDGIDVDTFYQELTHDYPQYFDENITSPADQLQAIAEWRNVTADKLLTPVAETVVNNNEIKSMKISNGGNENVRFENNGQEINREQERKNARGNKEIARFNRVVQNKQSKGLQNYEKQRILKNGEDFKATIAPKENYTKHENIVLQGFKEATGLDINVYETNKSTTEGAFYSDDGIFLKHNSLANEKSTNFKPYHEFGHWLEEHNKQEWQKVYNIIDDTITKNQIEDYKKVLNDKSRFDNMTEIEVREEIIKEITSDYFGNWANDIQNWIPYIKQGLISQEYQNFLANITLKNEIVGYNVFGSQEQQDAVYNQISQIMEDVIGKNNINIVDNSNNSVKFNDRENSKKVDINEKDDIIYNKNRIQLSKREYDSLRHAINTDSPNMSKGMNYKHYGDYFYIFDKLGFDSYRILGKIRIIDNEKIINKIMNEGVNYDRETRNINRLLENSKNEQRVYTTNNLNVEKEKSTTSNDRLSSSRISKEKSTSNRRTANIEKSNRDNQSRIKFSDRIDTQEIELPKNIDYTQNKNLTNDIFDKYNVFYTQNSVDEKRYSLFYNKHKSDFNDWNNQEVEYQKRNGKLNTGIYNIDDNLVKLTTTKEGDILYIEELYVEKQRKGLGTKIVNALKEYTEKAGLRLKTIKELSTAKGFWEKVLKKDNIKYSNRNDIDSEGRELTKEQQEFFKNSKARDDNGNLKVVYHGTGEGTFTKFNGGSFGANYYTDNIWSARSYQVGTSSYNKVYEGYINITNPLIINAENRNWSEIWRNAIKDTDVIKAIDDDFNNIYETYSTTDIAIAVKATKKYDGIIFNNIYDNSNNNKKELSTVYVTFNSNQFKNIDNLKPTKNDDIRYSNRTDTNENGEGGFYSQLENVIEEKMPKTANAQQIKNIINSCGVKADELAWIGLDDYLKQHSLEKISKQDVLDYIKANQIEIETVEKGDSKIRELTQPIKDDIANKETEIKKYLDKYNIDYEDDNVTRVYRLDGTMIGTIGDYMADGLEKLVDLNSFKMRDGNYINNTNDYENNIPGSIYVFSEQNFKEDMQKLAVLYDQLFEDYNNLSEIQGDYTDESIKESPKYKQYSLKGGENYQELLFTLPYLDSENKKQINKLNDEIAQLREKSFIPDPVMATEEQRLEANKIYAEINKKMLKIEELEKLDITNYKSPHWDEKNVLAHARTQDFEDINGNKVLFIDEIQSDMHQQGRKKGYTSKEQQQRIYKLNQEISDRQEEQRIIRTTYTESQEQRERNSKRYIEIADELDSLLAERADLENNGQVSDIFPFKKNWHEFVLRRMINNAVLQGYDKVAWTSGNQQNARYNLSQIIDIIDYNKPDNEHVTISAIKNDDGVFYKTIKSEELSDYIGKELALKILNSKDEFGRITDLDTQINKSGKDGMSGFYDNIIPKFLDKYLKKWDSKVETVTLKDADGKSKSEQMGFTVTDKMKQSVKEQGQPLFVDRNDLDNDIQESQNNTSNNIRFAKKLPKLDDGITNAERANAWIEMEIKKVEQTGNWDNSIPVTSRTDIRKTIEDYLGLGIKQGHFRQQAYGIYKTGRDVIRSKELKDMDTILHETGHALDLGNRIKINKETLSDELLRAIDRLGGYEKQPRTIKLDEGFAEIIREYSIIPKQAKEEFPQTVAVIEEIRQNNTSFDNFMKKIHQQVYNYIHQNPQNREHGNQSIGKKTDEMPINKEVIKNAVVTAIWDKEYMLKKAVNDFEKIGSKKTTASNNAYLLARLSNGIMDKATSMLSDGYIDENGNKIMPGLNQIGEILGDDEQRYNDLRDYLVAKRALDYRKKGLKTGLRYNDVMYVINKFQNDKQIQQASQVIYDTLDGVLQYAKNNGLISEENIKTLKESNTFYVPMQRVLENDKGNGYTGVKRGIYNFLKKRTGSDLDIKDILENIITNSTNIIQQVENNNVLKALYNQGEEIGLTGAIYDPISPLMKKTSTQNLEIWEKELQEQGIDTKNLDLEKTIDLFAPNIKVDRQNLITSLIDDNGKRIYLQFKDKAIFNSIMGMDKNTIGYVLKMSSYINTPLKLGATGLNLSFALTNIISDTQQAFYYSKASFIPVIDNVMGIIDIIAAENTYARNFLKSVAPDYAKRLEKLYTIYKQSGATSSTRMSQYRKSTQSLMKDIYGTKNSEVLGIEERFKPFKTFIDILGFIPDISERSTRFRVFEKNYDYYKEKGSSEMDTRILAALESRDATQDFGRAGFIGREINQVIAFSGARLGSGYTFLEKAKANTTKVAFNTAILIAISQMFKALSKDDDEIDELIQRKKDDNYITRIGDKIVTIKKPQGILRSIINIGEYAFDLFNGKIEEGKEWERLKQLIEDCIMDNMPADEITGYVPQAVAPLIENAINKDLYYNTEIVKSYDEQNLPDYMQYYDYNSQLAIALGKVFNYSPAKIDNLISGYFAGLGTQATDAIDYILSQAGIIPEKPDMGIEGNAIGKRFVVNVNSNSQSLNDIYDKKTELTKKKNSEEGLTTDEEEKFDNITNAISGISKINKQIKSIKQSDLTGKEKAKQIKELQKQRTDLARSGLGKNSIYNGTTEKNKLLEFYPSQSTLSKNKNKLELTDEMKSEYANLAYEYYNKYAKQGIYSDEKLDEIKSKAKTNAKNQLFQKYSNQVIKNK